MEHIGLMDGLKKVFEEYFLAFVSISLCIGTMRGVPHGLEVHMDRLGKGL